MPKKTFKCYFGCNKDGILHRFPNPFSTKSSTIIRYETWKAILDERDKRDKSDKYICEQLRLCNSHFDSSYKLPNGRLTYNAVPTLNLEHRTYSDETECHSCCFEDKANEPDTNHQPQETVCRLCLQCNVKMFDLQKYRLDTCYEQLMESCANSCTDLPQCVCYVCAKLLQKYSRFKSNCLDSQDILNEILDSGMKITVETVQEADQRNDKIELSVSKLEDFQHFGHNDTCVSLRDEPIENITQNPGYNNTSDNISDENQRTHDDTLMERTKETTSEPGVFHNKEQDTKRTNIEVQNTEELDNNYTVEYHNYASNVGETNNDVSGQIKNTSVPKQRLEGGNEGSNIAHLNKTSDETLVVNNNEKVKIGNKANKKIPSKRLKNKDSNVYLRKKSGKAIVVRNKEIKSHKRKKTVSTPNAGFKFKDEDSIIGHFNKTSDRVIVVSNNKEVKIGSKRKNTVPIQCERLEGQDEDCNKANIAPLVGNITDKDRIKIRNKILKTKSTTNERLKGKYSNVKQQHLSKTTKKAIVVKNKEIKSNKISKIVSIPNERFEVKDEDSNTAFLSETTGETLLIVCNNKKEVGNKRIKTTSNPTQKLKGNDEDSINAITMPLIKITTDKGLIKKRNKIQKNTTIPNKLEEKGDDMKVVHLNETTGEIMVLNNKEAKIDNKTNKIDLISSDELKYEYSNCIVNEMTGEVVVLSNKEVKIGNKTNKNEFISSDEPKYEYSDLVHLDETTGQVIVVKNKEIKTSKRNKSESIPNERLEGEDSNETTGRVILLSNKEFKIENKRYKTALIPSKRSGGKDEDSNNINRLVETIDFVPLVGTTMNKRIVKIGNKRKQTFEDIHRKKKDTNEVMYLCTRTGLPITFNDNKQKVKTRRQ